MTDQYDVTLQPSLRLRRPDHLHSTHRESSRRKSSEDDSPRRADSFTSNTATARDASLGARSSDGVPSRSGSVQHSTPREARAVHRSHRPKSTGAFLLSDPLLEDASQSYRQTGAAARRSRIGEPDGVRPTAASSARPAYTPEKAQAARRSDLGPAPGSGAIYQAGKGSAESHSVPEDDRSPGSGGRKRPAGASQASPTRAGAAAMPLDVDAANIVNMALNLSESRRLAANRNVSQPLPPRLMPVPDSAVGGSLKQQLQQQRRSSRTASPKADRGAVQRAASLSHRMTSPLQAVFDPNHDGVFRYHFSQSTIARAQKAKDYLELLAQYRRLLELVPPLSSSTALRNASTLSAPSSPETASAPVTPNFLPPGLGGELGRPYNPLQYIRNRKVRARGRLTIDGESQGFGDVVKVTDWVDEVAKWVATGHGRVPGNLALPPFAGADETLYESPPPLNSSRPSITISKPKRPRVDWAIEPADMIADVYWLEQDSHKMLIEDRHWRRIFPQDPELHRPLSRQTEALSRGTATPPLRPIEKMNGEALADAIARAQKAPKTGGDHVLSSAKERAKQKLQGLKSSHRRAGSSRAHDELGGRKSSLSDSSDSEGERRQRRRRDSFGSSSKDILEKQMMEMIAREARESKSEQPYDAETQDPRSRPQSIMTPERAGPDSTAASRQHSRRESRAELSDAGRSTHGSPLRSSRASLEVPALRGRPSVDYDTSPPVSPGLHPSRADASFVPAIGMDLSPAPSRAPSPRPGSPARNPFTKVKNIFRDRSRERTAEPPLSEKEDHAEPGAEALERVSSSPESGLDKQDTLDRVSSVSPGRKIVSRRGSASRGPHRHTGSVRLAKDESGSGLRSLFKGPRIDTVLRSGVSRVGDLLWRREPDAQDSDTSTSSDESDNQDRGRRRGLEDSRASTQKEAGRGQRPSKHFLDVMPPFLHTSESHDSVALMGAPLSRPSSHRSDRFEMLKPPRIDIESVASPPSSPPPEIQQPAEQENAETASRAGSRNEGVRAADARLNAVLALPQPFNSQRRRQFSNSSRSGRPWSVAEPTFEPGQAPTSRREIARLRTLMLSTGIMAMEISRRVNEPQLLDSPTAKNRDMPGVLGNMNVSWAEIASFSPEDQRELANRPVCQAELIPLAARVLSSSVQHSAQECQAAADALAGKEMPEVQRRVDALRGKLAVDLTSMTRDAADEADEVSRDLIVGQRLKVKRVVDIIEKMLRRKRRRFRWVRRAGWLALEWVLVGFMWYVWFMVMIARVFLGIGRGIVGGMRWLLWL